MSARDFHRTHRRLIPALALALTLESFSGARADPPVAIADTIVVVVSSASSITELTRLQLADLYLGRTTRFPDGSPAVPIDQRSGSTARTAFYQAYLDRSSAQMKAHWSKIIFTGRGRPPQVASTGQATQDLVARDARAIAYLDSSQVDSRVRVLRVR